MTRPTLLVCVAVAGGCADRFTTVPERPPAALQLAAAPTPEFPLMLTVHDSVGDQTGPVDVVAMVMRFDNMTGEYEITLSADAAHPFLGAFRVNINLFNPDMGTTAFIPSFFSDAVNDFNFSTPTTTLTLAGFHPSLFSWTVDHRVFTNSLGGTGNPDGASLFRSGVSGFPGGPPGVNEDMIAFPDRRQPAIIELAPGPRGGAIVSSSGEGNPDVSCSFGPFHTTQGTAVRTTEGNALLSCRFTGLDPIPQTERLTGWQCTLMLGGTSVSFQSLWVREPSGEAGVSCQFAGKPLFNAAVIFQGEGQPAQEGSITTPLGELPAGQVSGELVSVGLACSATPLLADPAGKIALIERGVCSFTEKLATARAAGALAAIVFNTLPSGDLLITMGGTPVAIPGVFVGRNTGLALRTAAPLEVTMQSCGRATSCRGAVAGVP